MHFSSLFRYLRGVHYFPLFLNFDFFLLIYPVFIFTILEFSFSFSYSFSLLLSFSFSFSFSFLFSLSFSFPSSFFIGYLSCTPHTAAGLKSKKSKSSRERGSIDGNKNDNETEEHAINKEVDGRDDENYNANSNEIDKNSKNDMIVLSRKSLKRLLTHTADSSLQLSKTEKSFHTHLISNSNSNSKKTEYFTPYDYNPKSLKQYVRALFKEKVFCSLHILISNFSLVLSRSKKSRRRTLGGNSREKV